MLKTGVLVAALLRKRKGEVTVKTIRIAMVDVFL
jgi:hypothetical protein